MCVCLCLQNISRLSSATEDEKEEDDDDEEDEDVDDVECRRKNLLF